MFWKKCPNCKERIKKSHSFCPYCGFSVNSDSDASDYGLLGKNDNIEDFKQDSSENLFGGPFVGRMFNKVFSMIEKEMEKAIKDYETQDKKNSENSLGNFELFINGQRVNIGNNPGLNKQQKKIRFPSPSDKIIKKSLKLPRKETESKLKRIGNKIIYEVDIGQVDSFDNLLINKLEDSIEIKAFDKDMVLFKNLPVSLPLVSYYLKNNKLFLEFQGKN